MRVSAGPRLASALAGAGSASRSGHDAEGGENENRIGRGRPVAVRPLFPFPPFLPLPDGQYCFPAPRIRVGAVLPPLLPPTMSETSSVFSSASAIPSTAAAVEADECGVVAVADTQMHLRIAAIFVILVGATGGALFPVLAKRSRWLKVPTSMFKCVHTIEAEKIMLTFPLFSHIPSYPFIYSYSHPHRL